MTSSEDGTTPGRSRLPEAQQLGHEELDRQHRVLLERWAGVAGAAAGEDPRRIAGKLWFIERYSQEHFAAEERLMRETAYPEAERHVRRHRLFGARFARLRQDAAAGRHAVSSADFAWMLHWFEHHIQEEDLRLKRHLEACRRTPAPAGAEPPPRPGR
jgi:hemerythrin